MGTVWLACVNPALDIYQFSMGFIVQDERKMTDET